jgi:NAD(P)H-flavin reductase
MDEPRAPAVVTALWRETPGLSGARLRVPAEVAAAHRRPGQILVVHPGDGEPVFLALASPPGDAELEVLVGPAAAARLELREGSELAVSGPSGPGFPLEEARGRDLLLFAVGSALAPLRPVVELVRRARSDFGQVTLHVGAHTAADLPYARSYPAWDRDRIDVVTSLSRPWVQERFALDPQPVEDAVAFCAGMPAMMDAVTDVLVRSGMPAGRIFRNW